MKRKTLLALFIIAILSFIMAIPSMAASSSVKGTPDPIEVNQGKECFFANGAAITISARTDGEEGALITWDGGELLVGPNVTVFGGMHDNATPVDSNITMTGGTIKNIIGGGLHESNTTSATILVTGGTLTSVQGGGAAAFATKCSEIDASYDDCSKSYSPTAEVKADTTKSVCYTGTTNVTLKGNTVVTSTVYGGGQGYAHTAEAVVNLSENVDVSAGWVTAGGANGNTTKATVNIAGGNFKHVHTVNRGTMDSAAIKVTGGTIENLYVAGIPVETTDKVQGTGTINSISFEVGQNTTVTNLLAGTNGSLTPVDFESGNIVAKVSDLANIENNDIKDDAIIVYTVKIDGTAYLVEEGKTLKDIPEYNTIITKAGYNFKGFKAGTQEWDVNTVIDDNYEFTTVFEQIVYDVTIADTTNGKVTASLDKAAEGETVTLTVNSNEGYKLKSLRVITAADSEVEVVDGKFVMPNLGVIVIAEFEKIEIDYVLPEEDDKDSSIGVIESETVKETLNSSLKADAELAQKVEESVQNGEKVTVSIKMEALEKDNINDEDKQKILQTVSQNQKVHQYIDISVLVETSDRHLGYLTQLTRTVKLSMKISEDLIKEGREFFILKLHDGKVQKIEAVLNGTNLEFEADQFSLFALAYEDVEATGSVPGDKENDELPSTGEKDDTPKTGAINIPVYVWITIAGMALVGIVTTKKSSKHSK